MIWRLLSGLVGLFLAIAVVSCNAEPLPNKSEVKQARILAVRADLPYAHPGETVNLEALVDDGRLEKPQPLRVFWFKAPCIDPPGGRYFDCYPYLEAAYPTGADLRPLLDEGPATSIDIPTTALDGVVTPPGRSGEPAVTSWTFMFACAGEVRRKVRVASLAENQAPFGCYGPDGAELSAEHGVFGFTRVTVTATRRNGVPKIMKIVHRGRELDPSVGLRVPRCKRTVLGDFFDGDCDWHGMDLLFDEADVEVDPDNVDAEGRVGRETIYIDWYVTLGRFIQPRTIVRDPFTGAPEIGNALYEPTRDEGRGLLWAVLHDNRGGVSWIQVPVEVYDGPDKGLL